MERLKNSLCYQIGPMDRVPDKGIEWRDDMSEFLWGLGCGVLNPCKKPVNYAQEVPDNIEYRKKLKAKAAQYRLEGDSSAEQDIQDEIISLMKPIVNVDLRMVDMAHFMIMYIDTDVHMCGSYGEQAMACMQRKPIVICCKQGKWGVPDWLWGICKPEMFFDNWDQVKEYLLHIHTSKKINNLGRWHFFDNYIITGNKNESIMDS